MTNGLFVVLNFSIIALTSALTGVAFAVDKPFDCEQRISRAVCLSKPIRNVFRSKRILDRVCAGEGTKYVRKITEFYRLLPPVLQREMCSLDRIFIEKEFWASGYAHPRLSVIGIHERFLEKRVSLSDWATWKERRAFAIDQIDEQIANGSPINLPIVKATSPGRVLPAAFYIVAHELAHRIDLSMGITKAGAGRFAKLSWQGYGQHVRSTTLPDYWRTPCFYMCRKKKIHLANATMVYKDLLGSSFVSLYATSGPTEDFAETVVYAILSRWQGVNLEIKLGRSRVLDLTSIRRNAILRRKLDFVEAILSNPGPIN